MNKGFNLIELMVTIAIIALLSAVAYTMYGPMMAKGKWANAAPCIGGITSRLVNYRTLYGKYPEDGTWWSDIGLTEEPCTDKYYKATYRKTAEGGYWVTVEDSKKSIYENPADSNNDTWIIGDSLDRPLHIHTKGLAEEDPIPADY